MDRFKVIDNSNMKKSTVEILGFSTSTETVRERTISLEPASSSARASGGSFYEGRVNITLDGHGQDDFWREHHFAVLNRLGRLDKQ